LIYTQIAKLSLRARRSGRPLCETEKRRYRVYPTFPSRPCHSRPAFRRDKLQRESRWTPRWMYSGNKFVLQHAAGCRVKARHDKGMVTGCRVKARHDEGDGEVVVIDSCVTVSRRFLWVTFLERKLTLESRFRKSRLGARRGGRPLCETEKPRYRVYPTFPSRPCHSRLAFRRDKLQRESRWTPVIRLCCNASLDAVSKHGMTRGW